VTRTDAHPPDYVLAEFAEGALDDTYAAEVQAHAVHCARCQETLQRLSDVTQLLRTTPQEVPVPGQVSARISAALAAESATAAHVAPMDEVTNVTSLEDRPVAWFRKRLPRVLAAAATAAVVGLAGYAVFSDGETPVPSAGENREDAATEEDGDDSAGMERQDTPPTVADAPDAMAEDANGDADALAEAALAVWADPAEVQPNCGQVLADDLDFELLGSTEVDGQVLVVLSDAGELFGWTLPDCDSPPTTGEPAVVVPEPGQ
jgi:hypothetical protein